MVGVNFYALDTALHLTLSGEHSYPAIMAPIKSAKSKSSSSSSVSLKKVKGENFYRNAKQVARAKMLTGGKAVRDKDGKIIQAAAFQKGEDETKPGRVQADRRWFGASIHTGLL